MAEYKDIRIHLHPDHLEVFDLETGEEVNRPDVAAVAEAAFTDAIEKAVVPFKRESR